LPRERSEDTASAQERQVAPAQKNDYQADNACGASEAPEPSPAASDTTKAEQADGNGERADAVGHFLPATEGDTAAAAIAATQSPLVVAPNASVAPLAAQPAPMSGSITVEDAMSQAATPQAATLQGQVMVGVNLIENSLAMAEQAELAAEAEQTNIAQETAPSPPVEFAWLPEQSDIPTQNKFPEASEEGAPASVAPFGQEEMVAHDALGKGAVAAKTFAPTAREESSEPATKTVESAATPAPPAAPAVRDSTVPASSSKTRALANLRSAPTDVRARAAEIGASRGAAPADEHALDGRSPLLPATDEIESSVTSASQLDASAGKSGAMCLPTGEGVAPPVATSSPGGSAAAPASAPAVAANLAPAVPLAHLPVEIAAKAEHGKNRFEIRLDPPELGRIEVRLDIDRDGRVSSRLIVDRPETLDLLKRDAAQIERALQNAGLKTSEQGLQFSLRDQSLPHRDDNAPNKGARLVLTENDTAPLEAMRNGYGRLFGLGGGIDIRV